MNLPLWSVFPFLASLIAISVMPWALPRTWQKYKDVFLLSLAVPMLALSASFDWSWVRDGLILYVSFIFTIGALYAIGGGMMLTGAPKANPMTNFGFLVAGAFLANLIGSLGATLLLLRPFVRSNRGRKHQLHLFVFYILVVANAGGLLTPLSSPPLVLATLTGVPSLWSSSLAQIWLFVLAILLIAFSCVDTYFYVSDPDFRGPGKKEEKVQFRLYGRWNLALLPMVVAALIVPKYVPEELGAWRVVASLAFLLAVVLISKKITPTQVLHGNSFSWQPFTSAALDYFAIFATMIPATKWIAMHAAQLPDITPLKLFWFSGIAASFMDNSAVMAAGLSAVRELGTEGITLAFGDGKVVSENLLMALVSGTIFFGSLTLFGHPVNAFVKRTFDEEGIATPGFWTYTPTVGIILLPVMFLVGLLFF